MSPIKYNNNGEWRPLEDTQNPNKIIDEVKNLTVDKNIADCLYYVKATGYKVIEFAFKGKFDLPTNSLVLSSGINIYKCPKIIEERTTNREINFTAYDGWVYLNNETVDEIRSKLEIIDLTLKSLSLFLNVPIHWRLKYRTLYQEGGQIKPSEDDFKRFDTIFSNKEFLDYEYPLLNSIDWYSKGKSSIDPSVAFSCYWSAIDGLAQDIADGRFKEAGFNEWPVTKQQLEAQAKEEIEEFCKIADKKKCITFIIDANSKYGYRVKRKIMHAVKEVFGEKHTATNELFNIKHSDKTLWEMRNDMAHGFEKSLPKLVGKEPATFANTMQTLSREFILRVLLKLKSGESIPPLSNEFIMSFSGFDPSSALAVSGKSITPSTDWRIRPEWI